MATALQIMGIDQKDSDMEKREDWLWQIARGLVIIPDAPVMGKAEDYANEEE